MSHVYLVKILPPLSLLPPQKILPSQVPLVANPITMNAVALLLPQQPPVGMGATLAPPHHHRAFFSKAEAIKFLLLLSRVCALVWVFHQGSTGIG